MATKNRIQILLEARDKTKKAFNDVERSSKGLTKTFTNLKGALAGVSFGAVFVALDQFSRRAYEANRAAVDFAERIGASAGALSELQVAGDLAGVAMSQVALAVQRSTRRIGEAAKGTGEAQDALKALGLEAQNLATLTADQQFDALADSLLAVENRTERLALAFKLFDSEGTAVVQMLDELNDAKELAQSSGAILSQDEVDALERYRREVAETDAAIRSLQQAWLVNPISTWTENIKEAGAKLVELVIDLTTVLVLMKQFPGVAAKAFATGGLTAVREEVDALAQSMRDLFGDQVGAGGEGSPISNLSDGAEATKVTFDALTLSMQQSLDILNLQAKGMEDVAEGMREIYRIEQSLGRDLTETELAAVRELVERRQQITAEMKVQAQLDKDMRAAEKQAAQNRRFLVGIVLKSTSEKCR
jgi:hypothetical protein